MVNLCYEFLTRLYATLLGRGSLFVFLILTWDFVQPVPVNVALGKPATAFYTCGDFGMEAFNTLSDAHKSASQLPRRTCSDLRPLNVSTKQSPVVKPTFPPEAIVDGNFSTSWQSVSRSRAFTYGEEIILEIYKGLEAMIQIDLLQVCVNSILLLCALI